ncbi:S41 family peptidase [Octadecabacter sp. G9-8]|uniref:S41 family peptidase n=1 Tax=Octadecabacter dasysiphoniae TaxID=2909341 RepID=A0ABS9CZN4_9RHOB|nr:S41 family peptidase [Octadecabacter dasysiphoniae]MCF2872735.1 S41 family peptidase [Octadecabacter dasysiphoniae]
MNLMRQLWIVIGAVVAAFVVSWVIYMPDADQRGAWRAQTGGAIITLGPLQAKLYSETSVSCVHELSFPAHLKLVEFAEGATVTLQGDILMLRVDGSLDPTPFVRIDALPETCGPANPNATPQQVFDALWAAMDEHYAFFDLHGVDWDARRALRPADGATLADNALFVVLSETLSGLDDGHVQLGASFDYFSPALAPDWFPDTVTFDRGDLRQAARDTIGTDLTLVDQTAIEYTLLPDGIGYVMIREMDLITPLGAREEPTIALAFQQVADALQDATAIVIDVRYNPGGSDSVAFGIASHFTDQPVDVLTKTTRDGDAQTAPFTATLWPFDDTPLTQPVILLTSKLTGSAAEIFTLAMGALPQVVTMGEPTSGGLSDILGFTLPNGWSLGLSHQTYRSMDGALFEAVGIPPDVPFDIEAAPLQLGEDPLLRAAFARARGQ